MLGFQNVAKYSFTSSTFGVIEILERRRGSVYRLRLSLCKGIGVSNVMRPVRGQDELVNDDED